MNKRQARKRAHAIVSALIDSYLKRDSDDDGDDWSLIKGELDQMAQRHFNLSDSDDSARLAKELNF